MKVLICLAGILGSLTGQIAFAGLCQNRDTNIHLFTKQSGGLMVVGREVRSTFGEIFKVESASYPNHCLVFQATGTSNPNMKLNFNCVSDGSRGCDCAAEVTSQTANLSFTCD